MKNNLTTKISFLISLLILVVGCTKTESNFDDEKSLIAVNLTSSRINVIAASEVSFTSTSNLLTNLTEQTVFYVNDIAIASNTYTFQEAGNYSVKAVYQNITSNTIVIRVENPIVVNNQFVNRVLVEEYSGTWCGNCPRIIYGTELLKQQTDFAVSVQIHLLNNDPFISPTGNTIANEQGVSGVPTGRINRTINWNGSQYQNVSQVINEIKSSSPVGLAINSILSASNININVLLGFDNTVLQTKLIVYIVEDNLFHTQANYSANLYGGLSSIPNFEYDGVFRSAVSSTFGDAITISGNQVQKNYTIAMPSNVSNSSNAKIVAFLIDANTNAVLNVRQANIGQSQVLEIL
jgi:Outer membrane protein Omp28